MISKILKGLYTTLFIIFTLFLLFVGDIAIALDPTLDPVLLSSSDSTIFMIEVFGHIILPSIIFFLTKRLIFDKSIFMKCYCVFGILCAFYEMYMIAFVGKHITISSAGAILCIIFVCFVFTGIFKLLKTLIGKIKEFIYEDEKTLS